MANMQPKLLGARFRPTQALQQAQATPFTAQMTAAVKALVSAQKKRKQPKSPALQNLTQIGDM